MTRLRGEGHSTYEHVLSSALGRVIEHAWPVLGWLLLVPVAWIAHRDWPYAPAACGVVLGGAGLAVLVLAEVRGRGRHLAAAVMFAAGCWLAAADVAGLTRGVCGVWFFGGLAAVVARMVRLHGPASHDLVVKLEGAAEAAGHEAVKVKQLTLHPTKTTGTLGLQPGKDTPETFARDVTKVEGAAGLPPGSLIPKPNADRADWVDFTLSDPRVLRRPQPWPGPSAPGASVAQPICRGIYQDGTRERYVVVGHHLQVMGKTGSAKSTGAGWNEVAESVTRYDSAVIGIDITKGSQFLGPFEASLHKLVTDEDELLEFMPRLHRCVKARANKMAELRLTKWQEGCPLKHLTFLFEEFPDIYNHLADHDQDEMLMSVVKAIRSAGGRLIFSLQRSDFTQMPTLARGQLAKMCFGVDSAADADFGLSEIQKDRNCRPELWAETQPGMCYVDAPTIPDTYKAMPMRTWYWGEDTRPVYEYAARYPWQMRPLDPVTAAALGLPGAEEDEDMRDEPPPRPAVTLAPPRAGQEEDEDMRDKPDVVVSYDADSAAAQLAVDEDEPERKMAPDQAARAFAGHVEACRRAGKTRLTIEDLLDLTGQTGHSRQWLYMMLGSWTDAGKLRRDNTVYPNEWVICGP